MQHVPAIAGRAGAMMRDRSRSVKFRLLEIGRIAGVFLGLITQRPPYTVVYFSVLTSRFRVPSTRMGHIV
jgi:hypothetical protein